MARLTITEAIKRSPVGKSQFYAKYIDGGLISISIDESGKKYVDSSELLRCFGEMKSVSSDSPAKESPVDARSDSAGLSVGAQSEMLKLLQEQLAKSERREEKYLAHIELLTLRLEPPSRPKQAKPRNIISRWWYGLDKE